MADARVDNQGVGLSVTRSGLAGGPPVLFLHGITSCRDSWLEQAARLGDRFDCWALDFRGHGTSDRAPGAYELSDYVADASAVLTEIGRATIIVGHSLGGVTAAHLGHTAHPLVRALFLEDPPLFFGDPAVFAGTLYPKLFAMLRDVISEMRASGAPFEAYLELARTTPSPLGGVAGDHTTPRQLRSRALQLQTFDPTVLDRAIDGSLFDCLEPFRPIERPVTVLAANEAYGAAFLGGDEQRLHQHSPHAEVVAFPEVGHSIRASSRSEGRYGDLLDAFATAHA
jgi:pimeloyl-ACP methyl ester carboxylesterase